MLESSTLPKLLLVDDDEFVLRATARVLGVAFEVTAISQPLDALDELQRSHWAVIVSDLNMPDMDGLTLLRHAQERCLDAVLVLTSSIPLAPGDSFEPARAFLQKPVLLDELVGLLGCWTQNEL